jgi:hypothetical protein
MIKSKYQMSNQNKNLNYKIGKLGFDWKLEIENLKLGSEV